jgi:beta-lactam-binding protein with PASTA domain
MAFVSLKPTADKVTCKGGESIDISFDVINPTDAALRVGVRATGPLKDKKWVELPSPAEVELPPKGQQKIKFTVKLPAEAAPASGEPAKVVFKGQVYDLNNPEITADAAVTVETPAKAGPPPTPTPGKNGPNWALIIGGIVGGVVVLGGIGVLVWFLTKPSKMPDVVGKDVVEAKEVLEKEGVKFVVKEDFTGQKPAGTVIGQTPAAGEKIPEEGNAIIVMELASVAVPQLIGLGVSAAEEELVKAGLALGERKYETTNRSPGGTVIAQHPAPGKPIISGDKVSMTIEKELVAVPNLVSLDYAQATALLEQFGLLQGKTTSAVQAGARSGAVLQQSPASGSRVDKGTRIDLVLQEKMIRVPSVVNLPEAQAKANIEGAGLKFRPVTQYQQTTRPNIVVAQDPSANVEKPQGSDVVVVVERNPLFVPGILTIPKDLVLKKEMIMTKPVLRAVPPAQPGQPTK